MISFHKPHFTQLEEDYLKQAMSNRKLSGDGEFTKKCHAWIEENTKAKKALLTTSCTHALEMAAILLNISKGDEVIMPSYTFVSTANAFALRGAKIVFVDIRPDTMNMDGTKIEAAITDKTKAIVPVHYAGVSCEMDTIMGIARQHNLFVVEDAAQGITSTYKGQALGTIGDIGTYSFHDTKNITCGEGGVLLINNESFIKRAEIIREKGTNRSQFFRGEIDKYSWKDIGSSYLPSELNASILLAQLERIDEIQTRRLDIWSIYHDSLLPLEQKGIIEFQKIPAECTNNAHMFYFKAKDLTERQKLIDYLKQNKIAALFHYIPLHSSDAGLKLGRFHENDIYTTADSERLVRLPLFYDLKKEEVEFVCQKIYDFYKIEK